MEPPPDHRVGFLDTVRGFAILLVFAYHSLSAAFGMDGLPWGSWFRDFTAARSFLALLPVTYGWTGVPIFFVVSGFCIHLSFSHRPHWLPFLQRRFCRIYPPYIFALLFFAALFPITRLNFSTRYGLGQLFSHLGMFHNLDGRFFFGINPSFWSIAVEVQLYALYPLLLFFVNRYGWRRALAGVALIELTLRLTLGMLLVIGSAEPPRWLSNSPLNYWFSWSVGAFVAERHVCGTTIVASKLQLWAVGIAAVGTSFFKPLSSMPFMLFALLAAGVVSRLLGRPDQSLPFPRAVQSHLRQVGLWSFSLYLMHQPLIWAVERLAGRIATGTYLHPLLLFSICLASWFLIVPIARLTYQLVELPSIRLGKRFQGPRTFTSGRTDSTGQSA